MSKEELITKLQSIADSVGSKLYNRVLTYSHPELLEELKQATAQYNPSNVNEMMYIMLKNAPMTCPNGKTPKFNTYELGYRTGCGRGCLCAKESQAAKLRDWHLNLTPDQKQELVDNAKSTFIKKYGVDNPVKNSMIKEKIELTNLERYGTKTPFESEIIKEKIKATNQERYGVDAARYSDVLQKKGKETTIRRYGGLMTQARAGAYAKYDGKNPFQDAAVKAKAEQTMIEKYGVAHALSNVQIYDSMVQSNIEKWGRPNVMQRHIPDALWSILNNKDAFANLIKDKSSRQVALELGIEDSGTVLKWARRHDLLDTMEFSPHSAMEHDMAQWLDSVGIVYQAHNRTILPNRLELDFYFPDHKFALELNGLFTHSENGAGKDRNYHLQKFKGCELKGIQLLQIWQDEYWQHRDVVRSKILYLCGMITNRVHARKCILTPIDDTKQEREFMDMNHIQGFADYRQWSLGAWYDGKLIAVMAFARQKGRLELVRYATDINSISPGLFSRMLNRSIKEWNFIDSVVSFSDNRVSNGRLYMNSGFTFVEEQLPGYCYTDDYATRMDRQSGMKRNLIKRHKLDPALADNYTEWELAQELGYDRLWDSGKRKWVFNLDQLI
jgi:hypothetical protein